MTIEATGQARSPYVECEDAKCCCHESSFFEPAPGPRVLLRPQSGGRVFPWTFHSSIGDFRRWEITDGVSVVAGKTFDTRAQAAQAVWEERQ